MAEIAHPPGPAPIPRCPECGAHPMKTHAESCSIGRANDEHWRNFDAVREAISTALHERRTDRPFMRRLRERLDNDRHILDRLAGGEGTQR